MFPELMMLGGMTLNRPSLPIPSHRVHFRVTGTAETPLPDGMPPTSLFDFGTGAVTVTDDPGDLVMTANKYIRALAVLPVDTKIEALVDEVVQARVKGVHKKRPLRRK